MVNRQNNLHRSLETFVNVPPVVQCPGVKIKYFGQKEICECLAQVRFISESFFHKAVCP